MNKKNAIIIGLLVVSVMGLARAYPALDSGNLYVCYDFGTGTQCTVWFNSTGFFNTPTVNTTDIYIAGDVVCTDCIEDADVSNTLTASDLVSGSSVVSDSEVDDDLTIDGGAINLGTNVFSGKLYPNNLTACGDTEILKMSGSDWICASDATGSGGNTTEQVQDAAWDVLTGTQDGITVTYQDATNDVDFEVGGAKNITISGGVIKGTKGYMNITDGGAMIFCIGC